MDKDYTYTHCRFEANSLLGITNVLVADFDEFLFCPRGKALLGSQVMNEMK